MTPITGSTGGKHPPLVPRTRQSYRARIFRFGGIAVFPLILCLAGPLFAQGTVDPRSEHLVFDTRDLRISDGGPLAG